MLEMFLDFVILIIKHPVFSGIFCGRVDKLKSRHFKKNRGHQPKYPPMGDILSGNNSKDEDMFFFLNPPCIKGIKNLFYTFMIYFLIFIFRVFP